MQLIPKHVFNGSFELLRVKRVGIQNRFVQKRSEIGNGQIVIESDER